MDSTLNRRSLSILSKTTYIPTLFSIALPGLINIHPEHRLTPSTFLFDVDDHRMLEDNNITQHFADVIENHFVRLFLLLCNNLLIFLFVVQQLNAHIQKLLILQLVYRPEMPY